MVGKPRVGDLFVGRGAPDNRISRHADSPSISIFSWASPHPQLGPVSPVPSLSGQYPTGRLPGRGGWASPLPTQTSAPSCSLFSDPRVHRPVVWSLPGSLAACWLRTARGLNVWFLRAAGSSSVFRIPLPSLVFCHYGSLKWHLGRRRDQKSLFLWRLLLGEPSPHPRPPHFTGSSAASAFQTLSVQREGSGGLETTSLEGR